MNKQDAGSYNFDLFNPAELARLKKQGEVLIEVEKQALVEAGLSKGMSVLDVACGPGVISQHLAELVQDGHVTGLDISEALLEQAQALKAEKKIANLDFQLGNIYELDQLNQKFDFVYARMLFQHLDRPELALKNILSVLNPGGTLVIADVDDAWLMMHPDDGSFQKLLDLSLKEQKKNGGNRYIGRELGLLMNEAGYADVQTKIVPVSSFDIGLIAFLDITTKFKVLQFPQDQMKAAQELLKAIYQSAEKTGAWGAVGVFVVIGKYPHS